MGEQNERIFVIGSPDIDIMLSDTLPSLQQAYEKYEVDFDTYSIFMYHPVTTEVEKLPEHILSLIHSEMCIRDRDYTEGGLLHIYGDADDSVYSAKDDKLKKALDEDPDAVIATLTGVFGKLRETMRCV